MENLTDLQAAILAKAISHSWDELPATDETELGPKNEAKAEAAFAAALEQPESVEAKIVLGEEQAANLLGQFKVYLDSAEDWGDTNRMEEELTALFSAE
jgi:hypothetical protein